MFNDARVLKLLFKRYWTRRSFDLRVWSEVHDEITIVLNSKKGAHWLELGWFYFHINLAKLFTPRWSNHITKFESLKFVSISNKTFHRKISRNIDVAMLSVYELSYRFETQWAPEQHCRRDCACQFEERSNSSIYTSRDFETSWDTMYRQISNVSGTNTQNFNVSRLVLQLPLPKLLMLGIKSRMKI